MFDDSNLLLLWSDSTLVSVLVWALISIASLYLARGPMHTLFDRTCLAIADILRFGSAQLLTFARRTAARNRDILHAAAEAASARRIERQLRRISERIDHDLSEYPALHRALSEQANRIDEDYRHAGDTPPTPPNWLAAIEAVSSIDANNDPALAMILKDMHHTLEAACHNALLEYRAANQRRFRSLRRMQPYFRHIAETLVVLQQRLEQVNVHAHAIDKHMGLYEALQARRRDSARRLSFEMHIRALGGAVLLSIAGLSALLSHRLIDEPLQALIGASATGNGTATTALILTALGLGVWIAESTGLTRLLGLNAYIDIRPRRYVTWLGIALLGALALLQASLAWSAYATAAGMPGPAWLAPAIAALLAAILPFTLALAAVPLEMLIHSTPSLIGGFMATASRMGAALLRLAAAIATALPAPLKKIYDLWIFLPLWCEQAFLATRKHAPEADEPPLEHSGSVKKS
jgi:hypothetical protein